MSKKDIESLSPGMGFVLSLLCVACCCFLAWKPISEITWPIVEGIVQSTSFGDRVDPLSKNRAKLYCLNVKYQYNVNGDTYFDLKELDRNRSEGTIKLRAHELEPGSKIKVHYNPVHPEESYIDHVLEEAPLPVLLTISAFAIFIAVWQFLLLLRSKLFENK